MNQIRKSHYFQIYIIKTKQFFNEQSICMIYTAHPGKNNFYILLSMLKPFSKNELAKIHWFYRLSSQQKMKTKLLKHLGFLLYQTQLLQLLSACILIYQKYKRENETLDLVHEKYREVTLTRNYQFYSCNKKYYILYCVHVNQKQFKSYILYY